MRHAKTCLRVLRIQGVQIRDNTIPGTADSAGTVVCHWKAVAVLRLGEEGSTRHDSDACSGSAEARVVVCTSFQIRSLPYAGVGVVFSWCLGEL